MDLWDVDLQNPVNRSHPLNRGLLSWLQVLPHSGWRGGLTWHDLCRRAHGTLTSITTSVAWRGDQINLDGTGYVNCGTSDIFNFTTGQFSIVVIARQNADSSSNRALVGRAVGGSAGYQLRLNSSDMLEFAMPSQTNQTSSLSMGDTNWHFAAYARIAVGNQEFTLDGRSESNSTASSPGSDSGRSLLIGRNDAGAPFNGRYRTVRIYDRAVFGGEMQELRKLLLTDCGNLLNRIPLPRYAAQEAPATGNRRRRLICGAAA